MAEIFGMCHNKNTNLFYSHEKSLFPALPADTLGPISEEDNVLLDGSVKDDIIGAIASCSLNGKYIVVFIFSHTLSVKNSTSHCRTRGWFSTYVDLVVLFSLFHQKFCVYIIKSKLLMKEAKKNN